MQKNLLFIAAALLGVGAAAWLLMPGDSSSSSSSSDEVVQASGDEGAAEPTTAKVTTTDPLDVERKDPEAEEERYVHPAAEEAAARLKTPFAQFALAAGPQWNALAYEIRKAGGDEELAADCKEMTNVLRDLRRDTEPDVGELLAEMQELLERAEDEVDEVPALRPSLEKLKTLMASLIEVEAAGSDDDGEPQVEQ